MITAQSVPWIGIIASLVSDLSVLICNSGCYEDCVRKRKQHVLIFFFFLNRHLLTSEHDIIPSRVVLVEGLAVLPFLLTVGGWVETGDRLPWAHGALSLLPANHSRWQVSLRHTDLFPQKQQPWLPTANIVQLGYFSKFVIVKMSKDTEETITPYYPLSTSLTRVAVYSGSLYKRAASAASLAFVRLLFAILVIKSRISDFHSMPLPCNPRFSFLALTQRKRAGSLVLAKPLVTSLIT